MQIQKSDITQYLKTAIKKDPTPMVTALIKKVMLSNDRIEIYYYYTNAKRPDDNHQTFSFYSATQNIAVETKGRITTVTYQIEYYF